MNELDVTFRSPSREADFVMPVAPHWTVAEVKEALSRAYAGRPEPGEIKLVLRGRLLRDTDRMCDVLGGDSVVHLVVPRTAARATRPPEPSIVEAVAHTT